MTIEDAKELLLQLGVTYIVVDSIIVSVERLGELDEDAKVLPFKRRAG